MAELKALIFDVDGTLYRQSPVRRAMLFRLIGAHLKTPRKGFSTFKALRAFRRAQEGLRTQAGTFEDAATAQLKLACEWAGMKTEVMTPLVTRWMEREPLGLLAGALREGASEMLQAARDRGLRLGVFSDYPALEKLKAMKIAHFFDAVVTAQDPEVRRFKPDPRGLLVTLRRLGVESHEAFYVGDRAEVDGVAAMRAGIRCAIITGPRLSLEVLGLSQATNAREHLDLASVQTR